MPVVSPKVVPGSLDAAATAARLPYARLAQEIARLLTDGGVQVAPRLVQALPGGGSLFVMPAHDAMLAISKLITYTPANIGSPRPTIQGDVLVFRIASGERVLLLDGPAVTARRTAAVSLLAAQRLAPVQAGPLLIVGAGEQGRAHLEAFAEGLGVREVLIHSRRAESAQSLAVHARARGLQARVIDNPAAALADCPLAVTCTPARTVVLHGTPRADTFIAAVGAFTPQMIELGGDLCRHIAQHGRIVLDAAGAAHEAGDLLQAGLDMARFETLADIVRQPPAPPAGPVLFKSCGWAGWDLAAARLALAMLTSEQVA